MSESNQFDNFSNISNSEAENAVSDTYTAESSADLYRTPNLDPAGGLAPENAADEVTETEAAIVQESEEITVEPVVFEVVDADAVEAAREVYGSEPVDYAGNVVEGMYGEAGWQAQDAGTAQNENPYQGYQSGGAQTAGNGDPYGGSASGNYSNRNNPYSGQNAQNSDLYGNSPYGGQNVQNNNLYGNNPYNGQNIQSNNSYGSNSYNGQSTQNNNSYGNNPYNAQDVQNGNPYGNSPYGGQNPQNSNSYGNSSYNGQNMQNNNPYGITPYIGQGAQNHSPYGSNSYNGQSTQNSSPYGSGGFYNGPNTQSNYQNPYDNPPGGNGYNGNNPYSPFAAPPKKNNNGLIIGVVIGIIVLFLVAVFALAYKLVDLYTTDKDKKRDTREEYDYDDYDDDEWDGNHNGGNYDDFFHDDYFDDDYDYPFGDDFPYDYDYDYDDFFGDDNDNGGSVDDDRYYSLHNEIRNDLQYSVKLEDYRYDTTYENVDIQVEYPVIEGENIPNLDKLNGAIKEEVDFIAEYFEEEYQDYMLDDDDYFMATSTGYVTYMDEEKMSIAFSEYIYSDYYNDVFVYCINLDMENGIVLDNESLLNTDDAFSVEFRKRSDTQNGKISYLTAMTDQEITKHFKSSDIIVFYIPQGMEIGFNYDAGWVTVTYEDFEKYLKVF